ncbi:Electron transfer DM13 [Lentzea xinjiangensis]|uniref:Electron transfer DM13 n=1 Tax=Lentzea xinjiangensis TaxID=402600 RepID=A0A1H9IWB9_9PSEU|nr:Electron transfer DM13 [Lentzea xinjiangensis]
MRVPATLKKPLVRKLLIALGILTLLMGVVSEPWLLFMNKSVREASPAGEVTAHALLISHEHDTSGTVQVLEAPDGTRTLRLENLSTSLGPDVRIWLSDQPVQAGIGGWFAFDDGDHLDLGPLKGDQGDQNYAIPHNADLTKLGSVSLWCARFHVSFGAADLNS